MALFEAPTDYPPCPTPFSDHVYKTAHGVDVPLRIWPAEVEGPAPFFIWFHGGGYIGGQHARINLWVVPGLRKRGFHVVSVAYRFTPQVKFPDIFGDVNDAHQWLRKNLPDILGKDKVDVEKYGVGGDSAGGTLATLAGHKFNPPPLAVVADCGITDWLITNYKGRETPLKGMPSSGRFTDAELRAAQTDHDPRNAETISVFTWHYEQKYKTIENLRDFIGMDDYEVTDKTYLRTEMFGYSAARGLVARMLFQIDTVEQIDDAFLKQLKEWSPYHLLEGKSTYPPTFLLHGADDPVVPLEQAQRFAKRLREIGVPYQEAYKEGASHEFDEFVYDEEDPTYKEFLIPALDFASKHVK